MWARETTQRGESTAKNIKPIGKNLRLRKTNSTCVYIHSTNRLFLYIASDVYNPQLSASKVYIEWLADEDEETGGIYKKK